ncbi:uncharacterized protein SPSK_02876 [Sporothrix schenckii 1099-18]|uniref:Uncharacterized protein n=1 Tax=Sporothrix schenckii 1099-18 TaxID=1397361 RepID=A0A0F2MCN3_SPOSC|nr:uncharacterized protein SPSK_02876 [Sporothrix schenckii 1099-18]KJR86844.1 hypothetical protein SPSK_02876 [Sporothrix schenckii 1099-18]
MRQRRPVNIAVDAPMRQELTGTGVYPPIPPIRMERAEYPSEMASWSSFLGDDSSLVTYAAWGVDGGVRTYEKRFEVAVAQP